jgi:ABC-type transport system involved in Fe-S cluster assembly fused permease/ATPase subunit
MGRSSVETKLDSLAPSCSAQDRTTIIVAHRLSTIVNADAVAGAAALRRIAAP